MEKVMVPNFPVNGMKFVLVEEPGYVAGIDEILVHLHESANASLTEIEELINDLRATMTSNNLRERVVSESPGPDVMECAGDCLDQGGSVVYREDGDLKLYAGDALVGLLIMDVLRTFSMSVIDALEEMDVNKFPIPSLIVKYIQDMDRDRVEVSGTMTSVTIETKLNCKAFPSYSTCIVAGELGGRPHVEVHVHRDGVQMLLSNDPAKQAPAKVFLKILNSFRYKAEQYIASTKPSMSDATMVNLFEVGYNMACMEEGGDLRDVRWKANQNQM